jgi:ribosomal protein S19E (S16A)
MHQRFRGPFTTNEPDTRARALRAMADGYSMDRTALTKLQAEGLIEIQESEWVLTPQGRIALALAAAH